MDLRLPLTELVTKVNGAFGAILTDSDGEAVSVFALPDQTDESPYTGKERLQLIGAYHIITLRSCLSLSQRFNTGTVNHLICRFASATVLIKALKNNYALMLAMRADGHVGKGLLYLNEIAEIINQDL